MSEQNWQHLFEVLLSDNQQPAAENSGARPASEAAILALPRVAAASDETGECSICLCEAVDAGGQGSRVMPCSHSFHSGCIGRWLRVHGSCPICRFVLPPAAEEERSAVLGARRWVGEVDPFGGRDPSELGWRRALHSGRRGSNVFEQLGIPRLVL